MQYKNTLKIITFMIFGFTSAFAAAEVDFPEQAAIPAGFTDMTNRQYWDYLKETMHAFDVQRYVKEHAYDCRLTREDTQDIAGITARENLKPLVAVILNNGEDVNLTLHWFNLKGNIANSYRNLPIQGIRGMSFLADNGLTPAFVKTYTLVRKDREWANTCRDFDALFERRSDVIFNSLEEFAESWQNKIIEGFKRSTNKTDGEALLADLIEWYGQPRYGEDIVATLCTGAGSTPEVLNESLEGAYAFQVVKIPTF
jgi:hypothetical protein